MGVCESYTEPKNKKKSNKGHQLYYAPITPYKPIFKPGQINSISYVDIKQKNNISLYKYKSIYNDKADLPTLITGTLDKENNSLDRTRNSKTINSIEETMNENSGDVEYIENGQINQEKVIQSTDKTTIDNYIEYIYNKNDENLSKSIIDIYNSKKLQTKNNK